MGCQGGIVPLSVSGGGGGCRSLRSGLPTWSPPGAQLSPVAPSGCVHAKMMALYILATSQFLVR